MGDEDKGNISRRKFVISSGAPLLAGWFVRGYGRYSLALPGLALAAPLPTATADIGQADLCVAG
jgi:hypothetical protein